MVEVEGWWDGGDGRDGGDRAMEGMVGMERMEVMERMEGMEGWSPSHFPSSSLDQAEGRAMPISCLGHHYVASTCVGERSSSGGAGGTSRQARWLCC